MGRTILYSIASLFCLVLLGSWFLIPEKPEIPLRVPIPENQPQQDADVLEEGPNPGTLIPGTGQASSIGGSWPQFRGPLRDGISTGPPIASSWLETGPKVVWTLSAGEGHAGAVIQDGRVYMMDYDEEKKEDVIRCLSLDDGVEIWRYTYSVKVKRNHGMSRTVPAVSGEYVVTLGPKCHVHCLNSRTGELVWKRNLVKEYGTVIPEWYAGQCPLIDGERVVLAPGGSALMTAVDLASGEPAWETPNPDKWRMTHASIVPMEFGGERQYAWCSSGGAVGVDAETGRLLWTLPEWKIKIATVPSPVSLGGGRILFTGGYGAGGLMVQLHRDGDGMRPEPVFRTDPETFGSNQQTPIFYRGNIYGVLPDGRPACLSQEGVLLWADGGYNFGLGPYMIVDDKFLVLDDDHKDPGKLCLFRVSPSGLKELASAKVVEGHDAWAPMAFTGGRVILRDSKTIVCLDLRAEEHAAGN
jgi:outer membrane protein assembly factor BamB